MAPKIKAKSASAKSSNASTTADSAPLPLPAFLRLLCSAPRHPLTMSQAIKAASKLVPAGYSSLTKLQLLTQVEMVKLGIDDEEIRKGIVALTDPKGAGKGSEAGKKKRPSREHDLDKPLPTRQIKEIVDSDFDFDEIHAEEALIKKSVITNRAPVMTAWATIVAERLGFRRQEALSIAQVYTDLNASSKGVSLGLMDPSALQPGAGPSQPFVDLMGRKVPVLSTQTGEWRAISKGSVADPSTAFSYIQRNFRQQMGAIVGGLRVLAESFEPQELNEKGYGLYVSFRPEVDGWGKKAELRLSSILELRRFLTHSNDLKSKDELSGHGGGGEAFEERLVKTEEGGNERVKVESSEEMVGAPGEVGEEESQSLAQEGKDEFDALLDDGDDAAFDELGL